MRYATSFFALVKCTKQSRIRVVLLFYGRHSIIFPVGWMSHKIKKTDII